MWIGAGALSAGQKKKLRGPEKLKWFRSSIEASVTARTVTSQTLNNSIDAEMLGVSFDLFVLEENVL